MVFLILDRVKIAIKLLTETEYTRIKKVLDDLKMPYDAKELPNRSITVQTEDTESYAGLFDALMDSEYKAGWCNIAEQLEQEGVITPKDGLAGDEIVVRETYYDSNDEHEIHKTYVNKALLDNGFSYLY